MLLNKYDHASSSLLRCTEQCPPGRYGEECERDCNCLNGGTCDPITGVCVCLAGWRGALCEEGTYAFIHLNLFFIFN